MQTPSHNQNNGFDRNRRQEPAVKKRINNQSGVGERKEGCARVNKNQNKFLDFLKGIEIQPSMIVLFAFVVLQIIKLLDLLITNKTFETVLIVPFQIITFLIPIFLFAKHKDRENPINYIMSLRVRPIKLYQLPLMLSSLALLVFGNMLLSLVFAGSSSLSDGFTLYNIFVSRTDGNFFYILYIILAYAIIPAFCEELVFRGILCREYEKYNVLCGIIASSLFFAMIHFDIYLLPMYFFSGFILALTMYATGSLIVSIAVHGAFNLVCLFGQNFINAFYTITGGTQGLFVFILSMLTLLTMAIFCSCCSKSYKIRAKYSKMPDMKILPRANKVTHIISKILLNPFAIGVFLIYIVVIIVGIFI